MLISDLAFRSVSGCADGTTGIGSYNSGVATGTKMRQGAAARSDQQGTVVLEQVPRWKLPGQGRMVSPNSRLEDRLIFNMERSVDGSGRRHADTIGIRLQRDVACHLAQAPATGRRQNVQRRNIDSSGCGSGTTTFLVATLFDSRRGPK